MIGIAISGFKPELLIGPFYSKKLDITEQLFILYSEDAKSIQTLNDVTKELVKLNVKVIPVKIKNIFDFYEVYFSVLDLIQKNNIDWINVTAGPGISLVSISTVLGKSKNLRYVYYHESKKNIPGYTDVINSNNIYIFTSRNNLFIPIMKILHIGNKNTNILYLSTQLGKSESTVSRRLKLLLDMGFIEFRGTGHGNSKKKFALTELGNMIYEYLKLE